MPSDLEQVDREVVEALALEGLDAYTDAIYTPPDGGDPIPDVYVVVDDLVNELTGEVTQGGAVLSLYRWQVGTPVQGATVQAGGTTWTITRRRSTTDQSEVHVEAKR